MKRLEYARWYVLFGRLCIGLILLSPGPGLTENPLPEPLPLEAALRTAGNEQHFDLEEINQRILEIEAELGIEEGNYGFSLDLQARLRRVEPSDFNVREETDDSAASLILTKPVYDFGRQNSREHLRFMQLNALQEQKRLKIGQRRLDILDKFFAVLNADNRFASENEALAIGFIRYDNALEDFELGLVPELEVLRLQSEYELIRQQRNLAEQNQRLTRAILAETMGYPNQLPSDLEIPQINYLRGLPDDPKELWAQALKHAQIAVLARANTQIARAAIGIADNEDGPSIDFEIEISTYERESRLRDDARVSLYFDIPLYSGASPSKTDLATARFRQSLAEQLQIESELRLQVLGLWQKLQQLQLEIEGKTIEQTYRDNYLDRSRAEYELEFKTDLGDSMVLYTRTSEDRLRAIYAFELAYQQLASLVGSEFLGQFAISE